MNAVNTTELVTLTVSSKYGQQSSAFYNVKILT